MRRSATTAALAIVFVLGALCAFLTAAPLHLSAAADTVSSWAPPNTKSGSEQRALFQGAPLLAGNSAFVNPDTKLFRNNTVAACAPVGASWDCTLAATDGSIAHLNVDAAGVVRAP
jgi:hypothetical protein